MLLCVVLFRERIVAWFVVRSPYKGLSVFGPFDAQGAWVEARDSLAHGAVGYALCAAVFVLARRRPKLAACLCLGLLSVDLASANSRLVLSVRKRSSRRGRKS